MTVYQEIFEVLKQRKIDNDNGNAPEKSYTCYLYQQGVDKICKKVGEEMDMWTAEFLKYFAVKKVDSPDKII